MIKGHEIPKKKKSNQIIFAIDYFAFNAETLIKVKFLFDCYRCRTKFL